MTEFGSDRMDDELPIDEVVWLQATLAETSILRSLEYNSCLSDIL